MPHVRVILHRCVSMRHGNSTQRGAARTCHCAARAPRAVRHLHAGILCVVRLPERQVAHLQKVEPRPRLLARLKPLRPGERVQDGQSHVGPAKLRKHRGVGGFDHRVDDRLRVDHDLNVVVRGAVEVVRLDDLEALVHQRRRVDCDLAAHRPVWVRARVLHLRQRSQLDWIIQTRCGTQVRRSVNLQLKRCNEGRAKTER